MDEWNDFKVVFFYFLISKFNMKQISDTVSVGIMRFYAALYCSQTNSLVLQRLKLIKRSACFLLSLDRNCKYYYAIYSKFLNCMFVELFQGECGCFGIDSWWFESPKQNNPENKSWLHFSPLFHCFMFDVQLCLRERLNQSALGMSSMMPACISQSPHSDQPLELLTQTTHKCQERAAPGVLVVLKWCFSYVEINI